MSMGPKHSRMRYILRIIISVAGKIVVTGLSF